MTFVEAEETSVDPAVGVRRRWILPLGMAIVFLSGAAVGGGVMTIVAQNHAREVLTHPEKMAGRLLPVLQQKLGLSEEQSQQVSEIIRRHHARLETIRAEVRPRFKSQWKLMDEEIAGVLDGPQKEQFREWSEAMRKRCLPEERASRTGNRQSKSGRHSKHRSEVKPE